MEMSRTEVATDEDIALLVPQFCQSRKKDLDLLFSYLAEEDFVAIAKISHTIKGIAKPYGFPTLERYMVSLEIAALAKDGAKCKELLNQINSYLQPYLLSN